MFRFLFIFVALVALISVLTRKPGPKRVLYVMLGLMIIYTVLKLTGVVDAIAPDRMGAW